MKTTKLLFIVLAIATTLLAPASGALLTGCGNSNSGNDCKPEYDNCIVNGNCETSFCKRCRGEGGSSPIKGRCKKCCQVCTDPNAPSPTPQPVKPTKKPTKRPKPTRSPTKKPTPQPQPKPTRSPTKRPTKYPTRRPPTRYPTRRPTRTPTKNPTPNPTKNPTPNPTKIPTPNPTKIPTPNPTAKPTERPSDTPTNKPTARLDNPTDRPSPPPTGRPTDVPVGGGATENPNGCNGQYTGDEITEIDFFNSQLVNNTLHNISGELRFEDVGQVDNVRIDLVITDATSPPRYPEIVDAWIYLEKPVPNNNGLNCDDNDLNCFFGQINLQAQKNKPESGNGVFKFAFVKTGTDEKVEVKHVDFTFFDLDNRQGIQEDLVIDLSQALYYKLSSNSEIVVVCEDNSPTPCPAGVKTVFEATENGTGGDNPRDPHNMTELQLNRAVTFTFENIESFEVGYNQYWVGPGTQNNKPRGGNFLFSGGSQLSTEPGECITKPPTPNPTAKPTSVEAVAPPSESPSGTPTIADSESPTIADSESPTTAPTDSPTHSPTAKPSAAPSASPSISVRPSGAPSDAPSLSPSDSPTATPTAAPTYFDCPADILLSRTDGNYTINLQESIKILEQTKSTVTVRLYNAFTTSDDVIDSIFFKYKEDEWSDKCFESQNVDGGTSYEDITIQCMHTVPAARLLICVADQGFKPLGDKDKATVPMCCNSDLEDGDKAVCYYLVVYCESHCTAEPTQSPTEAPIGASPTGPTARRNLYASNDLFADNEIEIDDDDAPLW